jgi:hypothetical protein
VLTGKAGEDKAAEGGAGSGGDYRYLLMPVRLAG